MPFDLLTPFLGLGSKEITLQKKKKGLCIEDVYFQVIYPGGYNQNTLFFSHHPFK